MTSAASLLGCFMTAECADLTTWPEWPFFRQQMPGGCPPRHFTAAVLVSVFIHALLAFLFWVVVVNRMAVAPVDSLFDRSLTVSLVTLPPPAAKSAVPEAPPDQSPQPVPDREAETEAAVETESPEILKAEAPEEKSPVIGEAPSIDPEEAYRSAQEARRMTISEIEEAPSWRSQARGRRRDTRMRRDWIPLRERLTKRFLMWNKRKLFKQTSILTNRHRSKELFSASDKIPRA